MSFQHHGERDPMDPELRKLFSSKQDELLKRFDAERAKTAPREYPDGRISGDDEGAVTFKIGSDPNKGVVVIEYSTPTLWVGMQPQQAIELAQVLIKHARAISKEPLVVSL
jgi:hypothetical protein